MRRTILALGCLAAASLPLLAGQGGKIGWKEDYDEAREGARKSGKPLIIYFTAEW